MPVTVGQQPLVSVIIPAYNQGPLLARAIDSALAQTYRYVEIIVVNDGSPDHVTRQTAGQYAGRITYIERPNGGVGAARNTGVEAAKGELIALLDQDDVWQPDKLRVEVRALRAHPGAAVVHSSYYLIDACGQRTGIVRLREREWRPLPDLLFDIEVSSCTTLFPKKLLEETGAFDPRLSGSDDWDLWLRIAARGYTFYCVGEPLAEYRVHEANASRSADLMVSTGLGVLDKFYALPSIPQVAQEYRGTAYSRRHAWAASVYYGAARLDEAREHLRRAASYDHEYVVSGRLLQSLIYERDPRPSAGTAEEALRFALQTLAGQLPPRQKRKLRSRARMVLALHANTPRGMLAGLSRAFLSDPALVFDRGLWGPASRLLARTASRLSHASCPVW